MSGRVLVGVKRVIDYAVKVISEVKLPIFFRAFKGIFLCSLI